MRVAHAAIHRLHHDMMMKKTCFGLPAAMPQMPETTSSPPTTAEGQPAATLTETAIDRAELQSMLDDPDFRGSLMNIMQAARSRTVPSSGASVAFEPQVPAAPMPD